MVKTKTLIFDSVPSVDWKFSDIKLLFNHLNGFIDNRSVPLLATYCWKFYRFKICSYFHSVYYINYASTYYLSLSHCNSGCFNDQLQQRVIKANHFQIILHEDILWTSQQFVWNR